MIKAVEQTALKGYLFTIEHHVNRDRSEFLVYGTKIEPLPHKVAKPEYIGRLPANDGK